MAIGYRYDNCCLHKIRDRLIFSQLLFKNNIFFISLIGSFLLPFLKLYFHVILKTPEPANEKSILYYIIIPFFLGPIIEEWFFRKTMYNYFKSNNIKWFAFLSALFFSIIHGYIINLYSLFSFLVSLIYAYFFLAKIYIFTKSTFVCILNHICYNFCTFLILNMHIFIL